MTGPIRTTQDKARKYSKSERTHEENQERAYIAASRRSDRSLEARMESARRASEIHRRRCGRAFRITEEAVLNEEMYEEEDPDYGQRVSRIYAALANDASLIHQQWLQSQRVRFDQATGMFVMNPLFQQFHQPQPGASQDSLPFFAYQPGSQPTSTPIPQETAAQTNPSGMMDSPVMPRSTTINSAHPLSPQEIKSSPVMNQQAAHTMFEDNPNPMAAQLNFFTYATPDFSNFDMTFPGMAYDMPMEPFSPNMETDSLASPQSPQLGQNVPQQMQQQHHYMQASNDHGADDVGAGPMSPGQATESKKFASPYAHIASDEQSLRDMQSKFMKPYNFTNSGATATLRHDASNELSYDDWLAFPGGSQG